MLATPLAMAGHLAGKRHTRAVARRLYVLSRRSGQEPEKPEPDAALVRARLFAEHSSTPLSEGAPEPPDIALALVHAALEWVR